MEDEALNVFKQLIEGGRYLSEIHMVHLDLNPSNIFRSSTKEGIIYKIGDYKIKSLVYQLSEEF